MRLTKSSGDRGAYAILYAVLMLVLLGIAALALDVAGVRADRRAAKNASDAGAIAGASALGLTSPNPNQACKNAVQFAAASLGTTAGTSDCSGFPVTVNCTVSTAMISRTFATNSGGWTIEVYWPVANASGLMQRPSVEQWSTPPVTQPIADADGSPCSRVGSRVYRTRPLVLGAGLGLGLNTATRSQDSVALAEIRPGEGKLVAPLLVLDPASCNALNVSGVGGVLVKATATIPGVIAVDSDGTGGDINCQGGKKVITVNNNSVIRAENSVNGARALILSYAIPDNVTNSYDPNNTSDTCQPTPGMFTTILCPRPSAQGVRITRSPVDNRYNCTISCAANKDYINQFKRYVGLDPATGAYSPGPALGTTPTDACAGIAPTYAGATFLQCTTGAKTITVSGVTVINGGGNPVRIDAKTLNVTGTLVFEDAQVNLNVDVLDVNGCIIFNPPDSPTESYGTTCAGTTPLQTTFGYAVSEDMPPVWVRGQIKVNGSFVARQTFIMQPEKSTMPALNGQLSISATGGRVYWSAPFGKTAAPPGMCTAAATANAYPSAACFEDLALWNEWDGPVNDPDTLNGQSQLFVDGTFFVPESGFTFGGGAGQSQTRAQFIAKRLNLNGQGLLTMTPDAERSTLLDFVVGALIR